MADTMQFDLVSPEKRLASLEATAVQIPGAEGDFTAMPDHAALITTLRPGILSVTAASGTSEFVVSGGFVEVNATATSVLAENAIPRADANRAAIDALIATAEEAAQAASAENADAAQKRVADTKALIEALGL